MNKCKIILIVFFIIVFAIGNFTNFSYADTFTNSVITKGDSFIDYGKKGKDANGNKIKTFNSNSVTSNIQQITRMISTIGVAVSVIISSILGLKIMTASVEEKAEVKQKLFPYLIGCVVTFGAFSIWSIVMTIAGNL